MWPFGRRARKDGHSDERLIFESRLVGERLVATADRLEVFADQLKTEVDRLQSAVKYMRPGGE